MAAVIVDASVPIALLDPRDALHNAAAAALTRHAGDDLKVPASAHSESLVGLAKQGDLPAAKHAVASLLLDVLPITDQIAEHAAELRARHPKLRLPDALVIATGSTLNADAVLTGEAGWRRLGKRISVI